MGAIVTSSQLRALKTSLELAYLNAYDSVRDTVWRTICSETTSKSKSALLALRDAFPEMREWVGDRHFHAPAVHSQEVRNPHFELSLSVDADDVEDDNVGGSLLDAAGLGAVAAKHPDVLLAQVLKNGDKTVGFDGQNFWDVDHPVDAVNHTGSQQNYWNGGKPLTAANYEEGRAAMASWRAGPDGRVIGVRPNILLVPSQLEPAAKRIVQSRLVNGGEDNPNVGTADIVVFDELGDEPTTWYLLDCRFPLKPFVKVNRSAAQFILINEPSAQGRFLNNQVQYGIDGRWGVGQALWYRAAKFRA